MTDVMSADDGEDLLLLIVEVGYASGIFTAEEASHRLNDFLHGDSLVNVEQLVREWKTKYFLKDSIDE